MSDKLELEIPEWDHLCHENARDLMLNQSYEIATGLREWLLGTPPEHPNLSALGDTIGVDFECVKNEGCGVTQEVSGVVLAATVLEHLPESVHETDRGQWYGAKRKNENGASLDDLKQTVIDMATSTLEGLVGTKMAECHEFVWEKVQEQHEAAQDAAVEAGEISEDELYEPEEDDVKQWVEDAIGEWE